MKDFDGWNFKKKKIDSFKNFQHPKEKEIWWCRVGINVGTEIYGKGQEYTRPVLVINSDSPESCIVIPITSKVKGNKYSHVIKTDDGLFHTAVLFQIRHVDKRRFKEKIYILSDDEYFKVREIFNTLYKI